VARGARFCLVDHPGYRVYAYPSSMSRQRENQSEMYRRCLLKHRYESVRELLKAAGHNDRISAWALASMALFRREPVQALEFIGAAESLITNADEILEPAGPCPLPEGWRVAFLRSSALLMASEWHDAQVWLQKAGEIHPTIEGTNNLGVALAHRGNASEAQSLFTRCLEQSPDYSDAQANRLAALPSCVTIHPLRREPTRHDYRQPSRF
jgi:tetratricopeptide (TPR) repeat protein